MNNIFEAYFRGENKLPEEDVEKTIDSIDEMIQNITDLLDLPPAHATDALNEIAAITDDLFQAMQELRDKLNLPPAKIIQGWSKNAP